MTEGRPIDDDGMPTAAEYVLGVLSPDERSSFERQLQQDSSLRTEVEYWERRLGVLADEVSPVEPPPQTWVNIEKRLNDSVTRTEHKSLWTSLPFWRWTALASGALAAACLAMLLVLQRTQDVNSPLVAKLDASGGQTPFIAAVASTRDAVTIIPAALTQANQRALELWLLAPNTKPISLGLVEPHRAIHIRIPAELIPHMTSQTSLAISLEPSGGSPTGQPTGPVIATGKLTNL